MLQSSPGRDLCPDVNIPNRYMSMTRGLDYLVRDLLPFREVHKRHFIAGIEVENVGNGESPTR